MLTVHKLSATNLDKMDSMCNRYLKKWCGLSRSASPNILHIPQFTDIPSVKAIYLQCHATALASSRIKADHIVNQALDSKLDRERQWSNKFSVAMYSQNALATAQSTLDPAKAYNLPTVKRTLVKSIKSEISESWNNHLKSLIQRGHFLRIYEQEQGDPTWKSFIFNLPRGTVKFLLNSALDTLPTNSNLCKWGKKSNSNCDLCRGKETLLHTLNSCPRMLDQGRYTWRHNSVLNLIVNALETYVHSSSWDIYTDLPGKICRGNSTIPAEIIHTTQRPDIVLVNPHEKKLAILELTVSFEPCMADARPRKQNRYAALVNDISDKGYKCELITIEVGSRGLLTKECAFSLKTLLKLLGIPLKWLHRLKSSLSKTSVLASYVIFYSKYDSNWNTPDFIKM